MKQIVFGTAGHIDHGKTSLVKALTGTDTDHLSDEKKRGMTIDLGFAYINKLITIIDVPGHEKFIRNMVAGASNIHFGILVVAADDGVMPQTREHLEILTLLGVRRGLVVLTKIDLVKDSEWLDLVIIELEDLLTSISFKFQSIHLINNLTGKGVENLKNEIFLLANEYKFLSRSENFRLNIDRAFSKKGFGTVVTGTVQNGIITNGDEVELLPNKIKTKVRGIQTHGSQTNSAVIGDRAALNLLNVKPELLHRGTVLATPNSLQPTYKIIANLNMIDRTLWKVKNKQRIRLHIGTSKILGRITLVNKHQLTKGESDNVIINLESPVAVTMDERFIIRSYSPMDTIAGGIVLDPMPTGKISILKDRTLNLPFKPISRFEYLLIKDWKIPKTKKEWQLYFFISEKKINQWITKLDIKKSNEGILFLNQVLINSENKLKSYFNSSYKKNPFRLILGIDRISSDLGWSEQWIKIVFTIMKKKMTLIEKKGGFFLSGFKPTYSKRDLEELNNIESVIKNSGKEPLLMKELIAQSSFNPKRIGDLLYMLFEKGKIVNLGKNFLISQANLDQVILDLRKLFKIKDKIAISDFKKITGLSRKTAIPFLEYLDRNDYTIRNTGGRIEGDALNG